MTPLSALFRSAVVVSVVLCFAGACRAQNPVQWSGSVKQSVERAAEQSLPLLFWVTGGKDFDDDDDLSDAQSDCFRDPAVVDFIHRRFVPVRVSRNSKVIEEARRLGLPTSHGLYCAVLTYDGRLLDQMGPFEVAEPVKFLAHLRGAFSKFCDDLYERDLRPIFENPEATKAKLRLAAQTVWRLGIRRADRDIIALLDRKDLQPTERSRLYDLLATLSTRDSISALLDRAEDKAAARALVKVEPAGLEWLVAALPAAEGEVSPRQAAAYQAVAHICRVLPARTAEWWARAKPDERAKEIEKLRGRAETLLDYAQDPVAPTR